MYDLKHHLKYNLEYNQYNYSYIFVKFLDHCGFPTCESSVPWWEKITWILFFPLHINSVFRAQFLKSRRQCFQISDEFLYAVSLYFKKSILKVVSVVKTVSIKTTKPCKQDLASALDFFTHYVLMSAISMARFSNWTQYLVISKIFFTSFNETVRTVLLT